MKNALFEQLLSKNNISKKEFSDYSKIPYNTVLGWKKKGTVPAYTLVILKDMNYRKMLDKKTANIPQKKVPTSLTPEEQRKLSLAFWGTNYTLDTIVLGIKEKNKKILNRLEQNLSSQIQHKILQKLQNV